MADEAIERQRERMLTQQLIPRGVVAPGVLSAMRQVPRQVFVAPEYYAQAYDDNPLPIGAGQTISQPYIVGLMTQLLDLQTNETVLEIGTGTGYQAAVLSYLAQQVHTVERHAPLAELAQRLLKDLGRTNIQVHLGDGSLGLPAYAPYDAILVAAAAPQVPPALLAQLAQGGRLVLPVGQPDAQYLERWTRHGNDYQHQRLIPVAFVPLIGEQGWT